MPPPRDGNSRPRQESGYPEIANGKASIRPRQARRCASPVRELAAWAIAVEHLHAFGLPAAVPPFAAAWLRRRGVRPDWEAAS